MDRITGDVKLRSYNKFFNLGERPETELDNLANTLSFPVEIRTKEKWLPCYSWTLSTKN